MQYRLWLLNSRIENSCTASQKTYVPNARDLSVPRLSVEVYVIVTRAGMQGCKADIEDLVAQSAVGRFYRRAMAHSHLAFLPSPSLSWRPCPLLFELARFGLSARGAVSHSVACRWLSRPQQRTSACRALGHPLQNAFRRAGYFVAGRFTLHSPGPFTASQPNTINITPAAWPIQASLIRVPTSVLRKAIGRVKNPNRLPREILKPSWRGDQDPLLCSCKISMQRLQRYRHRPSLNWKTNDAVTQR